MRIIFVILTLFPIVSFGQLNAIQAPISYYLNDLSFNDSILLAENGNEEFYWMIYRRGDPFKFKMIDEGDTLLSIQESNNKLRSIETNLYTSKYRYNLFGKLKWVMNDINEVGLDKLGPEWGEFIKARYVYTNGKLSRIDVYAGKKKKDLFMYYTLIYK